MIAVAPNGGAGRPRDPSSWDRPSAGRHLLKSSLWSVVAAMGARASTLVSMVLVANFLDSAAFGMLGLIQSTVFMSGVFAGTGTGIAAMKLVAENRDSDKPATARIVHSSLSLTVILSCAFAALLYVLAPWMSDFLLRRPEVMRPLRLATILLPLTALNMAQNGVLAGFESFRRQALTNLIAGIVSLPILLLSAVAGNLHAVIGGLTMAMAANCVIFQWAIRRSAADFDVELPRFLSPPGADARLIRFAIPAVMFSMLTAPTDWTCFAILTRTEGGLDQLGYFNAANQWFNVCRFVAQNLSVPLLPMLATAGMMKGQGSGARHVLGIGLRINLLAVIPVCGLCMLASPWIMAAYGSDYSNHWPTLVILLACAAAFTVQMPVLRALHAAGRVWLTFGLNLLWSCSYIVATLLLIRGGAQGLATARLLSYAIYAVVTLAVGWFVLRDDYASPPGESLTKERTEASANRRRAA